MLLRNTLTTAALLGSLLVASSVWAHAHLKSQVPPADSTVSAPADVRLVFSEGIEAAFTQVTLTKDGVAVPVKSIVTEGSDKKTLVVTPVAPLAPGSYQVQWHALSVDTHKSKGSYGFKIGE
jgi:methionine-rich copper-binding protein CopC